MSLVISPDVVQALGFYVYAYIDPRNDAIFYIGKGVGSRATDHLSDDSESAKVERIKEIHAAGIEPRIDILAYQLRDDNESSRIEAALIDLIGVGQLTNLVRGRFSDSYPRRSLRDFIMENDAKPVDVLEPALLIRINRQFKYGMTEDELYEHARGIWVIGPRRHKARFAMAVYAGIVREVYEIEAWHRAGSTPYETRNQAELAKARDKRWEFVGRVASNPKRSEYVGRSVSHLFRNGQQSPIVGIGLGD